jgi:ectoine hydroxylase-related dioxygenase (phytanoyl-CoA dioxygenase family)
MIDADLQAIDEHGYVILERLLGDDEVAAMRAALAPLLADADAGGTPLGRNDFEGVRTQRIYSLVAKHVLFERLVEHPRVLAICDALLEPNYLLTASQAINIHSGETAQAVHCDDAFYSIPRPRPAISVSTIVAIDDFTAENGATQIIPGSHRWDDAHVANQFRRIDFRTKARDQRVPEEAAVPHGLEPRLVDATMPAGSVIVFLGTLLHRGGANRSRAARLALSNQYCQPWARQQENYTLGIPPAQARAMSPRVQHLLGYSIHPPFMGHVHGVHPSRLLDEPS